MCSQLFILIPSLILALFTLTAKGGVIGTSARVAGPDMDFLCRLLLYDSEKKFIGICSGTLIGPNEIMTAAHCVRDIKPEDIKISCGFIKAIRSQLRVQPTRKGYSAYTAGIQFHEDLVADKIFIHPNYAGPERQWTSAHDSAIVSVKEASQLKPIEVFTQSLTTPMNGTQCATGGFGIAQNKIAGIPHRADIPVPLALNSSGLYLIRFIPVSKAALAELKKNLPLIAVDANKFLVKTGTDLVKRKFLTGGSLFGDSGGPLLCRSANDLKWKLAGINSMINFYMQDEQVVQSLYWALPEKESIQQPLSQ